MKAAFIIFLVALCLMGCAKELERLYYLQERSTGYCYQVRETDTHIFYEWIECDTVPDGSDLRMAEKLQDILKGE